MPQLPFEIPKSLTSYAEHFDKEPIKATTRLKKQLKKRGPDAVGHFLLAWFYHLKGMDDEAVDEALKARIFAPGSPFFEKLHYYLSHPNTLEAWTPERSATSKSRSGQTADHGPVLDLDNLIQKLSAVESNRIKPESSQPLESREKGKLSNDVSNMVSETLASIHENQGKIDAAIQTYKRLMELRKHKSKHYSEQISRLEKKKEEAADEEE